MNPPWLLTEILDSAQKYVPTERNRPYLLTNISLAMAVSMANSENPTLKM